MSYPNRLSDRVFLFFWDILCHLMMPIALVYLFKRGRKEPLYSQHLRERFGGGKRVQSGAIWIHTVSLGETRAAVPLIRALLAENERVLITNMTAAGRAEAAKLFESEIASGKVHLRWCPIELSWAIKRFMRAHQPKFGLIMEIEIWPQLIAGARRAKVPLIMAQAQYPDKSYERDQSGLGRIRARCVSGFDLILAKSKRHAKRFEHFSAPNVKVMGELRFEQPIKDAHLTAAHAFSRTIAPERPVFCLASTAPDEDEMLIPVLSALSASSKIKPFFIYVPRHPKDFATTWERLNKSGLKMLRRSTDFDADLTLTSQSSDDLDGLFGDSLGEINFYFSLAHGVFVGDSFNNEGSHNIIEPLRLKKPVVVGPSIWGIEYPALEALEAGVLTKLSGPQELQSHWGAFMPHQDQENIQQFLSNHAGATEKAMAFLRPYF